MPATEKKTPPYNASCLASQCLHAEVRHTLDRQPSNELLKFYSEHRKRSWTDMKAAMALLGIPGDEREAIKKRVGELMTKPGNEPRGWVAEVVGSFLLSSGKTAPLLSPYLVRVAWPAEPFRVAKGIDMMFLDQSDCSLILAEAKASNSSTPSTCKTVLQKLRGDLERTRLDKFLNANGADGWSEILYRFRTMRDAGKLDADDYARLAENHHYTRYGIAMGHKSANWTPLCQACPIDVEHSYPLSLWLLEVPDQDLFSQQLMAAELAMQRNL